MFSGVSVPPSLPAAPPTGGVLTASGGLQLPGPHTPWGQALTAPEGI